ncbi:hypothetical protein BDV93DRAFT_607377 [Ceratobasidium sp. AG-I]|nr:hypothetical protein BDV93DRAFT_607377 [Ceratobasidium sp. AG-I]
MDTYVGSPPTLILGIDVGTTYSGVSFLYLTKGVEPRSSIQRVTEWPGQRGKAEAKVPTLVWYDRHRRAVKIGAEAYKLRDAKAQADGLKLAKHFKYHLHPSTMAAQQELVKPPLPHGVTLDQVYADFMAYLLSNTKSFFEKKAVAPGSTWDTLLPAIHVVLAHPNGWGAPEQAFLRRAARRAGMASKDNQISFISEAEASVYFCLSRPSSNLALRLQIGEKVAVCDAGGSTVDTTLYNIAKTAPLQLEEVKPSACVQAGGIFVDDCTKQFLNQQFAMIDDLSSAQRIRYVADGAEDFINNAKNEFDGTDDEVVIKVGGPKDDFEEAGVDSGDMTIDSDTVAEFFAPCVDQIEASVGEQIGDYRIPYMFLVGGFGDSPYLFKCLKSKFGNSLITMNEKTAKAVADGCVIWQIERSVISRAVRCSYGTNVSERYDSTNPHHVGRDTYKRADGHLNVRYAWSEIIKLGTRMEYNDAKRNPYRQTYSNDNPTNMELKETIWATNTASPVHFILNKNGDTNPGLWKVCDLVADLSGLRGSLKSTGTVPNRYWYLDFFIAIRFGGTQLEAYVEWEQDGSTYTGPITVMPAEVQ